MFIIKGLIIIFIVIFIIVRIRRFIYSQLKFYYDNIEKVKNHAIIKFNDFLKYYNVNPEKWDLRNMRVRYRLKWPQELDESLQHDYRFVINWSNKNDSIDEEYGLIKFYRFSFIDCFRYKKWHENKLKEERIKEEQEEAIKQSKKHREDIIALLEGVQADIDKLRKQSQDEINQAVEVIKDVSERVG